jgi:hypothetical protein
MPPPSQISMFTPVSNLSRTQSGSSAHTSFVLANDEIAKMQRMKNEMNLLRMIYLNLRPYKNTNAKKMPAKNADKPI